MLLCSQAATPMIIEARTAYKALKLKASIFQEFHDVYTSCIQAEWEEKKIATELLEHFVKLAYMYFISLLSISKGKRNTR